MRDRLQSAGKACQDAGEAGYKRSRKGLVYFFTKDSVIHGIVMAGVFAVIQLTIRQVVAAANFLLFWTTKLIPWVPALELPVDLMMLLLLAVLVRGAFWADENTEEWRELVEETTEEETADDEGE